MVLMANQPDKIWKWGGDHSLPPLQTAVDTEQVRNVQDSEMYVSGTKIMYFMDPIGWHQLQLNLCYIHVTSYQGHSCG